MKQEQFEQPTTLLRQLANVDDVLKHWPNEGAGWLRMDSWGSTCGTYRCLFGDYLYRKDPDVLREFTINPSIDIFDKEFGDVFDWTEIFGIEDKTRSMDSRKAALQTHRDVMQQRINDWYAVREVQGVAV